VFDYVSNAFLHLIYFELDCVTPLLLSVSSFIGTFTGWRISFELSF